MALGFGDVPLEIVIRASNQLAPGLAAAGAQLKAFQAEVGRTGGQLSLPGIGGGGGGAGLLGAIGPTIGIAAGVAAIGGTVAFLDSAKNTYRATQTALADLKQAYESVNLPAKENIKNVEDYIAQNHTYIADLNQVREGFAALTRAGIDQRFVAKGVNDALEISILKHQDFSTTLHAVLLGLEGNGRGLKDLGINIKDYGDLTRSATQIANDDAAAKKKVDEATVSLAKAQRSLAEDHQRLHDKSTVTANDLMHEQDLKAKVATETQKLKDAQNNYVNVVAKGNDQIQSQGKYLQDVSGKGAGAKGTLDNLSKSQHDLNYAMEHFSTTVGPGLSQAQADWNEHLALGISRLEGLARWLGVVNDKLMSGKTGQPGGSGGHFVGGGHGSPGTWVPNATGGSATPMRGPTPS